MATISKSSKSIQMSKATCSELKKPNRCLVLNKPYGF